MLVCARVAHQTREKRHDTVWCRRVRWGEWAGTPREPVCRERDPALTRTPQRAGAWARFLAARLHARRWARAPRWHVAAAPLCPQSTVSEQTDTITNKVGAIYIGITVFVFRFLRSRSRHTHRVVSSNASARSAHTKALRIGHTRFAQVSHDSTPPLGLSIPPQPILPVAA